MSPSLTFALVAGGAAALGLIGLPPTHRARRPNPPRPSSRRAPTGATPSPEAPRRGGSSPAWVRRAIDELGLAVEPATAWIVTRWAAGMTVAVAAATGGMELALLAAAAILATPPTVGRLVARRSAARRDAQLPDALERLASNVRAGSALGPALVATAAVVPDPLGRELLAVAAEVEHGAALVVALERWGDQNGSDTEVRLVAAAVGLAAEAGGQVARSIDQVASTLRERREVRAEVRALATQARASAGVLAVAPLAFTALVSTVEPAAVGFLVTTPVGLACLVGGLGLEATGAAWMARILRSAT
jgi:tight adherence protein B